MRDGLAPEDGDPVVRGKAPVGRVTSARLSPTLGKGFGLAWVPIDLAQEGSTIDILVDGKALPAEVTLRPFYDPEGARLRE
jgi:glycine cleavage system aminomethyltransferase T